MNIRTRTSIGPSIKQQDAAMVRLLQRRCEIYRAALEKIAVGDGVYGAQAHEYKQIARAALNQEPA